MPEAPKVPARIEKQDAAEAFLEWYCTPKDEREYSRTELAENMEVSRERTYQWQEKAWFQNAARHRVLSEVAEHRAEVYNALVEEAKKGDIRAIRHYSEVMGDHVQQIDVTSGGESITTQDARMMDEDELIAQMIEEKVDSKSLQKKLKGMDITLDELQDLFAEFLEA
jgi:hypothetical protein